MLPPNTHLQMWRSLQPTQCVLGGKLRVEDPLSPRFPTPLFRPVITYTFAAGLPWCSIQIDLFIIPSYSFTWGFSMDHYSLSHFISLFNKVSFPCLRFISPLRWFQWWPRSFEWSSRAYMVHTVTEGPYQIETFIYGEIRYMFPWFVFALWCILNT